VNVRRGTDIAPEEPGDPSSTRAPVETSAGKGAGGTPAALPPRVLGRRLARCHAIDDLRLAARRELPRMIFDFIDGAAGTNATADANAQALCRHRLLPRAPIDVSARSPAVSVLGKPSRLPLVIGPTGYAAGIWPDGDLALARAAGRHGIPFVISNGANARLEAITAAAAGRIWLQHYLPVDRARTQALMRQARALGIEAVEVTVDTAVPGRRLLDLRNRFGMPFRWSAGKLVDVMLHPRWALRQLPHGMPRPGLMEADGDASWSTPSEFMKTQVNPSTSWDDLKWLRDQWPGPLLVKGLLDPSQVEPAIAAGYDGIVISNHGGRQLDGVVATIDMLGAFVAAGAGRIELLIDSGFRTGSDVLKACALGARAVQLGRATLYGLAVGGEAGVDHAVSLLETELDIAMALTGLNTIGEASPALVHAAPWKGHF
jgi:(S)-mandelate dehydrogenase